MESDEYVIGHLTGSKYLVAKFRGGEEPESKYIVELTSEGYTCECPAFDFSKSKPKSCKHGKMVQAKLASGELE